MSRLGLSALLLALSINPGCSQGTTLRNQDVSPDENDSNLDKRYEYVLLATNKTSTMQKEMTEAGEKGFRVVASGSWEAPSGVHCHDIL
jgi:hypothetical protein